MKKVKTTIRVAGLDSVADAIIMLYKSIPAIAEDAYLQSLMTAIEDYSARITTAIKSDRIYSNHEKIDKTRDDILKAISNMLRGYMSFPNEQKKARSEKLWTVFSKYKGIISERYDEKSSHIKSMLEDLESADMADAIKGLEGISYQLVALKSTQDEFDAAHYEYTVALAAKGENASSIKKPLLSVINNDLLPYIHAMAKVNYALYGDFAKQIDVAIEKANYVINRGSRDTDSSATNTPKETE